MNPIKRVGVAAPPKPVAAPAPVRPSLRPTTASVAAVVTRPTEEANDPLSRLRRSFNDIVAELRKVTWPTQRETINLTIVVLGLTAFVGVTLGTLDLVLAYLIQVLTGTVAQ